MKKKGANYWVVVSIQVLDYIDSKFKLPRKPQFSILLN